MPMFLDILAVYLGNILVLWSFNCLMDYWILGKNISRSVMPVMFLGKRVGRLVLAFLFLFL